MSEAKPDVPQPRYEQVGGFKHLICDEQEWLARPALWGIDELPVELRERKANLRDFYQHTRLTQLVPCNVCQRLFTEMISEESIIFAGETAELHQRYAEAHPVELPKCAGWPVWLGSINYARGIVCPSEARNSTLNALIDIAHQSIPATFQTPEWKMWERELALELVGPNPFRPVSFYPAWRTDTALALARQMYESRDFGAMPILADALQDAGCENEDILNHCRDANATHVRGCWVVDLVLGKE